MKVAQKAHESFPHYFHAAASKYQKHVLFYIVAQNRFDCTTGLLYHFVAVASKLHLDIWVKSKIALGVGHLVCA